MWLILDDCFISDEIEPGPLVGLMQPSCLHLTYSTSNFSQLWKTSGKVAERRNSFLRSEVFTDKLSSLPHGLTLRRIQHLGTSDASQALQRVHWSASERIHSREAVKILLSSQQKLRGLSVIKCCSIGLIPRKTLEYSTPHMHIECRLKY